MIGQKIKVIKRTAYGLRDNDYFFLKISALIHDLHAMIGEYKVGQLPSRIVWLSKIFWKLSLLILTFRYLLLLYMK